MSVNNNLDEKRITSGWININTTCNNRCQWCYRKDNLNTTHSLQLDFSTAEQIIDFFAQLNVYSCIFLGGEPTLYKNLDKLVKIAKNNGIKEVTVVSNGRLWSNLSILDKYIEAGLDVFSISIHSANKSLHDSISQVESWEETSQGIKNVIANNMKCSINLIAGYQNIGDIPDSIEKLLDWGVDQIIVSCAIPCISNGDFDSSNALDPKKFATLIDEIVDISPKVIILHELPLCLIKKDVFIKLAKENRIGFGCHIGIGRGLSFDADGKIIPCNSFANQPIIDIFQNGKIKYSAKEFEKIWFSDPEINDLRQEFNVFRSEICKTCDLWSICNCGCAITWGCYDPAQYISNELIDIKRSDILHWIKKTY